MNSTPSDERDALAQAIHDARGILGFDNDGDKEPHIGGDYAQYADFHRQDAREQRADYDAACDRADEAEARLKAVTALVDAAELAAEQSLARTFGGAPFAAFVSVEDLRATLADSVGA